MDRDKLTAEIQREEGFRRHVYQDHLGYWTIGWGFLVDERKPGGLPEDVAWVWLQSVLDERIETLQAIWDWFDDQPDPVQRALVNMSFQLGVSGLLGFRKTIDLIRQGRYYEAADEALDSKWAKEDTPNRARRVADLIRSGGHWP